MSTLQLNINCFVDFNRLVKTFLRHEIHNLAFCKILPFLNPNFVGMNNQMNGLKGFCYSSGNQKELTHYIKLLQFEQLETECFSKIRFRIDTIKHT